MAKYVPFGKISIQNREWPDKVIDHAPLWVSVDLRDGNQSLPVPMSVEQKLEFFELLVKTGFKKSKSVFRLHQKQNMCFYVDLLKKNVFLTM